MYFLSFVGLVAGFNMPSLHRRDDSHLFGKNKFIRSAKQHYYDEDAITMKKTVCNTDLVPSSHGNPCFVIAAGDSDALITNSKKISEAEIEKHHSPELSLFNLLYWITSSSKAANQLIKDGVDFVVAVSEKGELCERVFLAPETLGNTIFGPAQITITNRQMETVTEGWSVGSSVSFSTSPFSPFGSFESRIDIDYHESIMTTATAALSRGFSAEEGKTCTPTLLMSSINCLPTKATVLLGKKGKEFKFYQTDIKETLVPIVQDKAEFFNSIYGCIDYSE
ncbi:hypothetical protein DSO57_1010481 [Entomophthora muscae]|uniref:Uncharacterized protein n=1 Tax=Entomophthora muscae TaxID=34485 RepID=A0ACC2SJI3_9FUNG|nr:hypothetical protein DSO57_1010481 [Entomophthora muscae]